MALRLAVIFEKFAEECYQIIGDNDIHVQSHGAIALTHNTLPDLTEFPDDDSGWKALPPRLAEKALTFPSKISASYSYLRYIRDHEVSNSDHLFPYCSEEAAKRGVDAIKIAAQLRHDYQFPKLDSDLQERLITELQKIRDREAKYAQRESLI